MPAKDVFHEKVFNCRYSQETPGLTQVQDISLCVSLLGFLCQMPDTSVGKHS